MGLVGMGRAFNLRFMPNGPLRTNCYHRQMPRVGIFGGGGNFSYTENINIQNGPSGFWGFMAGLGQGLFGGMFGMGMYGMGGGLFGMLNARQAVTPQGPEQAQDNQSKLTQLRNLFKAKDVTIEETAAGKYSVTDSKGNPVGKPNMTFEEAYDELSKLNKSETVKEAVVPESQKSGNAQEIDNELKNKSQVNNPQDELDKKNVKANVPKKVNKSDETNKSDKVDDKKTESKTKLPIQWNIRRHMFNRFSGEAVIEFTDDKGKHRFFKAEKNGWHSYVGTEAGFKAELANMLRTQLEQAGLADRYTI